jgi:hypothetical protein
MQSNHKKFICQTYWKIFPRECALVDKEIATALSIGIHFLKHYEDLSHSVAKYKIFFLKRTYLCIKQPIDKTFISKSFKNQYLI